MSAKTLDCIIVFIISILDCIISIKFLLGLLEKAFEKYWIILAVSLSLIYTVICGFISESVYFMLVSLVFHLLIAVILFHGNILIRIFYGFIVVVFGGITEAISGFSIAIFARIPFDNVVNIPLLYLTAAVTSKIFLILIFQAILRFRKTKSESIPLKYWLILIFVPIASFISADINAIKDYDYTSSRLMPIFFTLLVLIFINISIFIIFDEIIKITELDKIRVISEQQLKIQQNHYKLMLENNKSVRGIWHDMNNHLIVLQTFLELNKLDELKKYLQDLSNQVRSKGTLLNTGNLVIDSIISEKLLNAQRNECLITHEIIISKDLNIDSIDLCIILGNALDNALDECLRITDKEIKKEVKLKIINKDNQIFISVVNPFEGIIDIKDNNILTKKYDNENHGFGLKNIEHTVEKYNGNINIFTEANLFYLNIAIKIS